MTIIMDANSRTATPGTVDERATLTSFLDFQRDTLAWKCSGLTDEQLALRAVEPSGISLLGLLRHMTGVERSWFERVIAGEKTEPAYYSEEKPNDDFDALETHSVAEVYADWQSACARSREITAARPLEFGGSTQSGEICSLRWVLAHMIEEYARHNGHADLIRERIDGSVGE
jgi:uncharacterized damage-inducible protein DinB